MRTSVMAAAAVMAVAIAGIGAFAWSALSGSRSRSSGSRSRAPEVTHADDRAGAKAAGAKREGTRSVRPAVDAPAVAAPPAMGATDPDSAGGDAEGSSGRPVAVVPGVDPGSPAAGIDPRSPFLPGAKAGAGTPSSPFPLAPPGDAGSACPAGMVDVGAFCIDATEVTNAAYKVFLDARPAWRVQPKACQWNTEYTPTGGPPPADRRPVVGVDWCDAWLFCAWSGKRMCGRMGGGNNSPGAFKDASQSEWFHVCTNAGTTAFSYGDTFDGTKCAHSEDGSLAPTGAIASCVGTTPPFDAVFDMSGNAWEWEDSCAGEAGGGDLCRVRGGGQHSTSAEVSCSMDYLAKREQTFKTVGFRCCAPRRPGF